MASGQNSASPPAPLRVLVDIAASGPAPEAIATAQAAVIAALPADGVRVLRRYGNLPLLALEVSPAALAPLLQIPQVTAVRPDREKAPLE